jgi:hypothetical protein
MLKTFELTIEIELVINISLFPILGQAGSRLTKTSGTNLEEV